MTLKNFICHPLTALIFRVEYKATVPLPEGNASEQIFFTLAWTLHLPAYNAAGELADELIDTTFTMGPGSTPTGDLLWDANAEDTNFYQLRMKAFVSISATPPTVANAPQTGVPGMAGFIK